MFLHWMLRRFIRIGTLTIRFADGREACFHGRTEGPAVTIRLHDRAMERALFLEPELACGEGYMDGRLTIEDGGNLFDFMDLMGANYAANRHGMGTLFHRLVAALARFARRIHQYNPAARAKSNVAHHYDLSGELYDLFLDPDRQYSCAYYVAEDDDLATAQWRKKHHIAAKLMPNQGNRVLDIGCGWGGMGLFLVRECGCHVTGITLSDEQLSVSRARAAAAGLDDRIAFHLRDFRRQEGTFDRIVSIGMFEHVGVGYYRAFFDKIFDLLSDDGVALVHTIGRSSPPASTSAWVRKYIFPGGYCPALSEITTEIEKTGLFITDIEVLRLHYAKTLRHWRQRFMQNWDQAVALYDERFARMWEFYLVASEVAFLRLGYVVFQLQLAKRQDAVPQTRGYIDEWEQRATGPRPLGSAAAQ